jgi:hypothetical protein
MPERPSRHSLLTATRPAWPWLLTILVIAWAVVQLRFQNRIWWCVCGQPTLWWTDTQSSHNSQHFLDPYSFSHVLHGMIFYGVLAWLTPRLSLPWRFLIATIIECAWEVFENTQFVIQRYRNATMALGYEGDSIFNCLGDILTCAIGFELARRAGLKISVGIFLVIEFILLVTIRDSLFLNVVMLIYPLDALKAWQLGK